MVLSGLNVAFDCLRLLLSTFYMTLINLIFIRTILLTPSFSSSNTRDFPLPREDYKATLEPSRGHSQATTLGFDIYYEQLGKPRKIVKERHLRELEYYLET